MTPERWQRVLEVFDSARGRPPTEAADFVRAECGQDAEMCSEVLRMVAEHARGGMLDHSPWDDPTAAAAAPACDQPVFPPGQLVSGRYRIVRFLGRGGMGEVYEAEDLELKEHVALKTLLPAIASDGRMIARFKREIQLSRKVSHPNVCRVFDLARHPADGPASDATVFLTMEFLPGETLSARLRREGRMPAAEALPILSQMAEGLDAAHRAGVIHRDFKPANVMLVPSEGVTRAVVTDFGLARSFAPSGETTATLTGTLMGTLDYMAPELLSGGAATVASDVYAFGTVAYEMVTGARPFAGGAPLGGAYLRLKGPAPSPRTRAPDLDEKWERAILRALDPNPERRFAKPGHFIQALKGEAPSVTVPLPKVTRRRLIAVAVAAAVLMVCALAWQAWRRSIRLPTIKTIAVLPLRNVGNATDSQAFCEGLTESLIGRLSQLERFDDHFSVVPTVEFNSRTIRNAADTRRAFGATLAITGSVERTAERTRMALNLIDPATSRQLDAYVLVAPEDRSTALLEQSFDHIVKTLRLTLSSASRREIAAGGTSSAAAFQFCQQGIGLLRRRDGPQLDDAITLFQKALREDSGYALAFAGLGEAYATKFTATKEPELARQARLNGEHAVALNDSLASVHLALGIIDSRTGRLSDALNEFQRTIKLDPASFYSYHWLGRTLDSMGRTEEAEQAYLAVLSMRPSYWLAHNGLGAFYYQHGQFDKAEPLLRKAIDLAPDNQITHTNLGGVYLAKGLYDAAEEELKKSVATKETYIGDSNLGSAYLMNQRYEEAAAVLEKAVKLNPNDPRVWRNLGDAYRFGRRPAEAPPCFRKAIDLVERQLSVDPANTEALANLALYWAKLGDRSRALAALGRALAGAGVNANTHFNACIVLVLAGKTPSAWEEVRKALDAGFSPELVRKEPELAPLRKDPRFLSLLNGDRQVHEGEKK